MLVKRPKELAVAAAYRRRQLGLTQSAVAERVGLKQKTISAFENRPEKVLLSTAFLILSALHLDLKTIPKEADLNDTATWNEEW